MKKFVAPVAEIEKLDLVDVIATSTDPDDSSTTPTVDNELPGERG